jgi:uncharacterized lipoprotein YddW (UPF0748 family)
LLFSKLRLPQMRRLMACAGTGFGLLVSLSAPVFAQDNVQSETDRIVLNPPDAANAEMRGMWVVRDSMTSPAAIRKVVAVAVKNNFNTLFVQVRGRGDAFYQSPYEPRAESLWKQPADFDPLQTMIDEAHKHNIQVHAWLNTYLTWSGPKAPRSPQHLWNAHRAWFATDKSGKASAIPNAHSEGAFLQPSSPAVQEHLLNVFSHVATQYDVDGVHFDYCRYNGLAHDFSPATLARFRDFMQGKMTADQIQRMDALLGKDKLAYVHAFGTEWSDWRRMQVTELVRRVSTTVKAAKPWIQVSAAVFADANDAFRARGQDWRLWLKENYLDAVALMSYDKRTDRLVAQTKHAVEAAGEKKVYAGIGAWRLSAHDVAAKITQVRKAGASGVNLFSYGSVTTRPEYLHTLRRGVFASRAGIPPMRWLGSRKKN